MGDRSSTQPGVDGVLVVDKPGDLSSHDVVHRARRILGQRKIGHIGTLDPIATGVLPLVVGRATRLASLLSAGDKVYDAVIRLGLVTDTYDTTGEPVAAPGMGPVDLERGAIEIVLRRFIGTFRQQPPPYSAKKIGGVRAYTLARQKRPPSLAPVEVSVRAIEVQEIEGDRISCRVTCAPGFYVRALAHDVGASLGYGGCLEQLRRVRSGAFGIADAVTLEALEHDPASARDRVIPMRRLLPDLPHVVLTEHGLRLVQHGNLLTAADFARGALPASADAALVPVRVFAPDGRLIAIASRGDGPVLQPRIVLV